jgi:hypothetical protein
MTDETYLQLFLEPIIKSKNYRPKFGVGGKEDGVSLDKFLTLYGSDPFYAWIGLNSDLMYAAHRAAGGMTSLYRQIGIGCEVLFRQIITDQTGYDDPALASWSYATTTPSGKTKTLKLDARLEISQINNSLVATAVQQWMRGMCAQLDATVPPHGAVFEVRQGYKSKDSKRQNADIDNTAVAWSKGYLPVFAIFSAQIDSDIVLRYRNSRSTVLVGNLVNTPTSSLYTFTKEVLGYDLAAFFTRNSHAIQTQIQDVVQTLLSAA